MIYASHHVKRREGKAQAWTCPYLPPKPETHSLHSLPWAQPAMSLTFVPVPSWLVFSVPVSVWHAPHRTSPLLLHSTMIFGSTIAVKYITGIERALKGNSDTCFSFWH